MASVFYKQHHRQEQHDVTPRRPAVLVAVIVPWAVTVPVVIVGVPVVVGMFVVVSMLVAATIVSGSAMFAIVLLAPVHLVHGAPDGDGADQHEDEQGDAANQRGQKEPRHHQETEFAAVPEHDGHAAE